MREKCRHCQQLIEPCPWCPNWRHIIGPANFTAHFCGGQSRNPVAEPEPQDQPA